MVFAEKSDVQNSSVQIFRVERLSENTSNLFRDKRDAKLKRGIDFQHLSLL